MQCVSSIGLSNNQRPRDILKRLISPYRAFGSRTSGTPFSIGDVKFRPNELNRLGEVHAKHYREIRGLRADSEGPPNRPWMFCSMEPSGESSDQEEDLMEGTSQESEGQCCGCMKSV